MHTVPITSPEITAVELQIANHPLNSIYDRFAILARCIWVTGLMYPDADPDLKGRMLLSIREHLREIQCWPEPWQDVLAPAWAWWMSALEDEEREWKEAADA
jgi:hypothetical protein